MIQNRFYRRLAAVMAAWAFWLGACPSGAFAFPSGSVSTFQDPAVRDRQIEKIVQALSRPEARIHLRMSGINPKELPQKLAKLDDSQLAFIAQKSEGVKAGGILGVIIALLVIAILVVILIWLLSDKEVKVVEKKDG